MAPIETVAGVLALAFLVAYGLFFLYAAIEVLRWPPDDPRWDEYGDALAGDPFDEYRF